MNSFNIITIHSQMIIVIIHLDIQKYINTLGSFLGRMAYYALNKFILGPFLLNSYVAPLFVIIIWFWIQR